MKSKMLLWVVAIAVVCSGAADASLVDRGNGLVYDTDLGITWLNSSQSLLTYSQAMVWIDSLNSAEYAGYSNWRLPRTPGTGTYSYEGELGKLYLTGRPYNWWGQPNSVNNGPLSSINEDNYYWYGNDEPGGWLAWNFIFFDGRQTWCGMENNLLSAVAVHSGDIAAVPIPGAVWLLGSGLIGLVGLRRKFQR